MLLTSKYSTNSPDLFIGGISVYMYLYLFWKSLVIGIQSPIGVPFCIQVFGNHIWLCFVKNIFLLWIFCYLDHFRKKTEAKLHGNCH